MTVKYKNTTDEELLEMLREYSIKINNVPTSTIIHKDKDKQGLPDIRVYTRRFGSWANALKLAGFENIINAYRFKEKCQDLVHILENKEDSNLSWKSDKKIWVVCPLCKNRQLKRMKSLTDFGFRCNLCGDSKSKPEKIISSILIQLNIWFESEKCFDWSNGKRYDFYIPSLNCIIETHGLQHYKEINHFNNRTLKEEQENDKIKKELAINNGVNNYIVINCSNPVVKDLVKEILNNKDLLEIVDLSIIDYNKTCIESLSNSRYKTVKECCDCYNKGMTIPEITKELNMSNSSATRCLIFGDSINICDYNRKYAWDKRKLREDFGCKSKRVYCLEENKEYDNAKTAFREISKISDKHFVYSNFCECCRGLRNNCYKGFHVYYIEELGEENNVD